MRSSSPVIAVWWNFWWLEKKREVLEVKNDEAQTMIDKYRFGTHYFLINDPMLERRSNKDLRLVSLHSRPQNLTMTVYWFLSIFELGPQSLARRGSGGVPQPRAAQSALAGVRGRSPRENLRNLTVSNFENNLQKCNLRLEQRRKKCT